MTEPAGSAAKLLCAALAAGADAITKALQPTQASFDLAPQADEDIDDWGDSEQPAPVDRATVLREAIAVARAEGHRLEREVGIEAARGARSVAYLLRTRLGEEQLAASPCGRNDRHDAHTYEVYGRPFRCPGHAGPQPDEGEKGAPEDQEQPQRGELWSLLDWSLWGSGMGDTFREPLADTMLAAITPERLRQAEELMEAWHASGRQPLGRRRYEELEAERKQAEQERDGAYRERAQLLAWLATLYPSVIAPASDIDEPGWQLLYLYVAHRQLSWHIASRDAELFVHVEHVPPGDSRAQWDGHSTDEKYEHIRRLANPQAQPSELPAGPPCIPDHSVGVHCPGCAADA